MTITGNAVLDEVAKGDTVIASQRLEILRYFPLLTLYQSVQGLAAQFSARSSLPPNASDDAVDIAAATVDGLDYLLTWNCKHIANVQIQGKLAEISLDFGYVLPILCTPNELMGDSVKSFSTTNKPVVKKNQLNKLASYSSRK